MRTTAAALSGILIGITLTLHLQHATWARRLTWWAFTTDARRTHPHIYGRGKP